MLLVRALLAFLALPAVVAGLVPALMVHGKPIAGTAAPIAWPILFLGCVLLLWCVRDFYVTGRGTLAPWDPPKRLVATGPYRFVRNPMYIAVAAILLGWTLLYQSPALGIYLIAVLVVFHLRVVLYEEPKLKAAFGSDWKSYAREVNRWIPVIGKRGR